MATVGEIVREVNEDEQVKALAFCASSGICRSSVEYRNWKRMVRICDPKFKSRLKVYDNWLSFENFINDMGPRTEGQMLVRLDSDKGYFPGNCVWARR